MIQISPTVSGELYTEIRREVDRRFPAGRFVAIRGSEVVADASSHRRLVEALGLLQISPKDLLILQAGMDSPASAIIFCTDPPDSSHA